MKQRNRLLSLLLALVMVLSLFPTTTSFAASKKVVNPKYKTLTIEVGQTETIGITKSKGVSVKKVKYSSTSKRVATVSKKGKVKGKNTGVATIKINVKYTYKNKSYSKTLKTKVKVTPYIQKPCEEHKYGDYVTKVSPTCEKDGIEEATCTVCGEVITNTLPKLGHNYDDGVITREATCAVDEIKTFTCFNCKDTYTETTHKDVAHIWDEGTIIHEPTCKTEGKKIFKCTICNATKTEKIDKLEEHTWDDGIYTIEPTCTEDGEILYTCKICKTTKTEVAHCDGDHEWDEGIITKEPTCTQYGAKTYTCIKCKTATKIESIDPTGDHDFGDWSTEIDASCLQIGKKVRSCKYCSVKEYENIDKLEHDYNWDENEGDDLIVESATCLSKGATYYKCKLCGDIKDLNTTNTAPHKLPDQWTEITHAICGQTGKIRKSCEYGCGYHEDQPVVNNHNHTYRQVDYEDSLYTTKHKTAPTCSTTGTKIYTCQNECAWCHKPCSIIDGQGSIKYENDVYDPDNHKVNGLFDKEIREASVFYTGLSRKACIRCEHINYNEYVRHNTKVNCIISNKKSIDSIDSIDNPTYNLFRNSNYTRSLNSNLRVGSRFDNELHEIDTRLFSDICDYGDNIYLFIPLSTDIHGMSRLPYYFTINDGSKSYTVQVKIDNYSDDTLVFTLSNNGKNEEYKMNCRYGKSVINESNKFNYGDAELLYFNNHSIYDNNNGIQISARMMLYGISRVISDLQTEYDNYLKSTTGMYSGQKEFTISWPSYYESSKIYYINKTQNN